MFGIMFTVLWCCYYGLKNILCTLGSKKWLHAVIKGTNKFMKRKYAFGGLSVN